jgi:hypothetical protein
MPKHKSINWKGFNHGGLKPYYDQNSHIPEFVDRFHEHYSKHIPNFYEPDEGHSSAKQVKADSSSTPSSSSAPDNRQTERKAAVKPEVTKPEPVSSTVPEGIGDVEMPLVGTAMGQGGAGDGNAPPSGEMWEAQTPHTNFGKKTSTYKKVHHFLTFGIAHTWISKTEFGTNRRTLTTGLAEIPWQKLFMYMTEAEFKLLPKGAYCIECRVSIVNRGVRIGFETAAVDTTLATLNQIQNIQIAEGLNKTGWGVNFFYDSFDPVQTMKPTSTALPVYIQYPQLMYGDPNATIENYIPNHQLGYKMPLYNFFCLFTHDAAFGGCPPIIEKIKMLDGKTSINKTVHTAKWTPKVAPITTPLKFNRWSLPNDVSVAVNGCISNGFFTNMAGPTSNTGTDFGSTATSVNPSKPDVGDFGYLDDIDKTQLYKQGPWGQYQNLQIQPSLHIGVQSIPALTTSTYFSSVNKWSDSECTWEVTCEMDVGEFNPTMFPHLGDANVPAGDQHFRMLPPGKFVDTETRATFAGLYCTT